MAGEINLQRALHSQAPLFPNSHFPKEIVLQIFGFLGPRALSTARLINISWQTTIDQTAALWIPHFYSLKGKRFTKKPLLNPRFFLMFDHALNKFFKNAYRSDVSNLKKQPTAIKKIYSDFSLEDHSILPHFFENISSLSLENLDLGIIAINNSDEKIFPLYCAVDQSSLEKLASFNDLAFSYSKLEWQKSCEKVIQSIEKNKFGKEFVWHQKDDLLNARLHFIKAYKTLKPVMQTFIKKFEITQLFIDKEESLVLLGECTVHITIEDIILAVDNQRFKEKLTHARLFSKLISVAEGPKEFFSLYYDLDLEKKMIEQSTSNFLKEDLELWKKTISEVDPSIKNAFML